MSAIALPLVIAESALLQSYKLATPPVSKEAESPSNLVLLVLLVFSGRGGGGLSLGDREPL